MPQSDMNELAGQNLGRYQLEEEIGRGAMGVVYQGKQLVLGRKVAIKVLPHSLAQDSSYVARFTREAKIMAGLNHPNIVQIYDAGRQHTHLYFVMEFVQGPTLASLLYLDGIIPPYLAIEYAAQIAEALDAAYREGHVIHRDIKPENLMLNRWGKVKVMDFGLARAPGLQVITVAKTLVGSIYYASPEQITGLPLDNRSDIYALGVVLYEMVCGQRPFTGRSMIEVTQMIAQGCPIPPRELNPEITPELEQIILTALAHDRKQRYADADRMAQALRTLSLNTQQRSDGVPDPPTIPYQDQEFHGARTNKNITMRYPKRPQPKPPITFNLEAEDILALHQGPDTAPGQQSIHFDSRNQQRTKINNQQTLEVPGTHNNTPKEGKQYENQETTHLPTIQEKKIWDPLHRLFK